METRQQRNRLTLYGNLRKTPLKITSYWQKYVKFGNRFISSSMTKEEFINEYFTNQKDFERLYDELTSTLQTNDEFLIPDTIPLEKFYDSFACDLEWASLVGACDGAAERNVEYANQQKAAEEKKQRDIAILNKFPPCVRNVGTLIDSETDKPYIRSDVNGRYREYVFYLDGVLKAPRFNRTGTYTCNEFGSIALNLDNTGQPMSAPTGSTDTPPAAAPTGSTTTPPPASSGRPPLKTRRCDGVYTLGCLNMKAIAQLQRCLNLVSSRYPRGNGFYDYALDDKLKSIGYMSGFTDADVSKICSGDTKTNVVQEEDPVGNKPKESPRQTYEKYYARFDGTQTDRIKLNMYNIPDEDLKNLNEYFATQGLFRIKNSKRRYKTSFVWGKKPS